MTVLSSGGGSPTAARPFCRLTFSLRNRNPSAGSETSVTCGALRALFGLLAFFDATAPRIRNSSADFPPLIAAVNHFGLNPRPAQVSSGFCGLRYFGATGPLSPNPDPFFPRLIGEFRSGLEFDVDVGFASLLRTD